MVVDIERLILALRLAFGAGVGERLDSVGTSREGLAGCGGEGERDTRASAKGREAGEISGTRAAVVIIVVVAAAEESVEEVTEGRCWNMLATDEIRIWNSGVPATAEPASARTRADFIAMVVG